MPTKRERDYYRMGFQDGQKRLYEGGPYYGRGRVSDIPEYELGLQEMVTRGTQPKRKRKLSAWQKFVKANSRKKEFRYRDGKLNLKKMGVAYRRKKRR